MKNRIVFFSEDYLYGSIIHQYFQTATNFTYAGWFQNFDKLIFQLKTDKPEFLLMEIPRESELLIIHELKKNYGLNSLVIVSSRDDRASILQALKAGADGYLTKNLDVRETMEDLNKLAFGGVALSPAVAKSIVKGFWKANHSPLTRTETKVLKFISLGHTYSSLAMNLDISKGTAKTHMKNIYRKLNIHRKSEALKRAYLERLIN